MENETRTAQHEEKVKKHKTKLLIGSILVIILFFTAMLTILGMSGHGHIKEKPASSIDRVESESESKAISEQETGADESSQLMDQPDTSNSVQNDTSQNTTPDNQQPMDTGYNIVLVFADGTRRLSNQIPTYGAWQQSTSSPATNGHLGRTAYVQKSFVEMGGVTTEAGKKDHRPEAMQRFNQEYDADSSNMMKNSIAYTD